VRIANASGVTDGNGSAILSGISGAILGFIRDVNGTHSSCSLSWPFLFCFAVLFTVRYWRLGWLVRGCVVLAWTVRIMGLSCGDVVFQWSVFVWLLLMRLLAGI
jgi:hypothetical protein